MNSVLAWRQGLMNTTKLKQFVAKNYHEPKAAKIFAAGVPAALGGGDASYQEMCEMRSRSRNMPAGWLSVSTSTLPESDPWHQERSR